MNALFSEMKVKSTLLFSLFAKIYQGLSGITSSMFGYLFYGTFTNTCINSVASKGISHSWPDYRNESFISVLANIPLVI